MTTSSVPPKLRRRREGGWCGTGGGQNVISNAKDRLPNFSVEGRIDNTIAAIDAPVGGSVRVVSSEYKIASIDLQLVRKEEVMMAGKTASDISEVQVRPTRHALCRLTPSPPKIGA